MKRDTRLLDKSDWDNPLQYCEAGSEDEADLMLEWTRGDLIDMVQQLDQKLYELEEKLCPKK